MYDVIFLCDVIATVVGRVDSALEASRGIFERGQVDGGAVSGVLRRVRLARRAGVDRAAAPH